MKSIRYMVTTTLLSQCYQSAWNLQHDFRIVKILNYLCFIQTMKQRKNISYPVMSVPTPIATLYFHHKQRKVDTAAYSTAHQESGIIATGNYRHPNRQEQFKLKTPLQALFFAYFQPLHSFLKLQIIYLFFIYVFRCWFFFFAGIFNFIR